MYDSLDVSIRARHCWRAIRQSSTSLRWRRLFQSAPAIAGGRSFMAVLHPQETVVVSIRARHCWRAIRAPPKVCHWVLVVSIRARHCWRAIRHHPGVHGRFCWCFNPRPPLLAGDPLLFGKVGSQAGAVSIRARHCWRAIRASPADGVEVRMFQSAPAIAGGRSFSKGFLWLPRERFNPRPPLLAGDPF